MKSTTAMFDEMAALRATIVELEAENARLTELDKDHTEEVVRWRELAEAQRGVGLALEACREELAAIQRQEPFIKIYVGHGEFALCDVPDYDLVCGYWWRMSTKRGFTRYAQTHDSHVTNNRKRVTMHALIMGQRDGAEIDHINGNGLDNRRANLRFVSHSENMLNMKIRNGRNDKGVSFEKETGLWRAYGPSINGRRAHFGRFATEQEAMAARAKSLAAAPKPGEKQ